MNNPSLAAKAWLGSMRAVGEAGAGVRAAATKRERKAADKLFADAVKAEGKAWEALSASRGDYLANAARAESGDALPEASEAAEVVESTPAAEA